MVFKSINPATEEVFAEHPEHSERRVENRLAAAESAFEGWRKTDFTERSTYMKSAGMLLRSRRSDLAKLMTLEMGKPITGGEQEIDKCADACDFFAEHAEKMLAAENIESDASSSFVRYEP